MTMKSFFAHVFRPKSPCLTKTNGAIALARCKGKDVRSLEPTDPIGEAEKAELYRTGRFAEMTEGQTGL
jgi:hypothetical protein